MSTHRSNSVAESSRRTFAVKDAPNGSDLIDAIVEGHWRIAPYICSLGIVFACGVALIISCLAELGAAPNGSHGHVKRVRAERRGHEPELSLPSTVARGRVSCMRSGSRFATVASKLGAPAYARHPGRWSVHSRSSGVGNRIGAPSSRRPRSCPVAATYAASAAALATVAPLA